MSPLNRGPLMPPRMPPVGMRPPPPRFGRLPMPGMPPRMPPPPPPMGPAFGPMRPRMPPPPPRPGSMMRPGPGGPPPLPLFGPRTRGPPPLMHPMMGPRGMGPRGPPMRPGPRGILPPQGLPHMRPRFPPGNGTTKAKTINNAKKGIKLEELELKKPWMTDEIRGEIQRKNKLYAKAKKNKDAKEWEEFKDLRNKVTRMIKDAKNEYFSKNPDQAALYQDDQDYHDDRDENNQSEDEDVIYYCEICDREFMTDKLLNDHNSTHKICGIDGCTFSAHPKLVEKHIAMQHRTGYFSKLKNLTTPEDIEKWINERKRKYPTKSNVDSKKAEQAEKEARGEIMNKNFKSKISNKSRENVNIKSKRRKKRLRKKPEKKAEDVEIEETCQGVRQFRGTKIFNEEEKSVCEITNEEFKLENPITDDEDEVQMTNEFPEVQRTNALPEPIIKPIGSLVANYSSSDDEPPEEIPIKKVKVEEINISKDTSASSEALDTAAREQLPLVKNSVEFNKRDKISHKDNSKQNNNNNNNNINKRKNLYQRHALLEQLLSQSITHERNYICQCIKYIVDNNFFTQNAQ
ncbi:FMR1-interacting protein NUFIP1 [Microplitis demolitor]|uniref:FMR1-interacting protein NUFIP1 n=1 Tax=Microplitis demolitor TaxID=69319 RepID=UPI0006D4D4B0|nr:FMR1-interacting protein NUFIP1 [Microplitis demolitor]